MKQLGSILPNYRYRTQILSMALQDHTLWEELADAVEELIDSEVSRPIRQLANLRNSDVILDEVVSKTPVAIQDSGGVLTPAVYTYRITAFNDFNEAIGSTPVQIAVSSPDNTIDLSWYPVVGAKGYRVYGRNTLDPLADNLGLIAEVTETVFRDSGNLIPSVEETVPTVQSANRELLITLVNLLGQYYPDSSIFANADFRRFLIYSPQYFSEKGTPIFADFLSFSINARMFVYRLWDKGEPVDPRSTNPNAYENLIGISEDVRETPLNLTAVDQPNVSPNTLAAGKYRYQVTAYFSRTVALLDVEGLPTDPVSITVDGTEQVSLNWSQVSGASGYKVYGGIGNDLVLLKTRVGQTSNSFVVNGEPPESASTYSKLAVWHGGKWFPTSHVNIEYDRNKFIYDLSKNIYGGFSPDDANKAIGLLFRLIAPIQLVLNSIVVNEALPSMDVHLEAAVHEIMIEDSGLEP